MIGKFAAIAASMLDRSGAPHNIWLTLARSCLPGTAMDDTAPASVEAMTLAMPPPPSDNCCKWEIPWKMPCAPTI